MRSWIDHLRQRYWRYVMAAVVALAWAAFLIGSKVNAINDYLIATGTTQLLILTLVAQVSASVIGRRPPKPFIEKNDSDTVPRLVAEVRARSIQEADLLEYSATSIEQVIRDLAERECQVRVLVKHPESVGPFQARRIAASLESLLGRHYMNRVTVRCYRMNPSLRGRRLGGELVNVGWYIPYIEDRRLSRFEVKGHRNPMLFADLTSKEGRQLNEMFQGLFNDIWTAVDTEDANVVLSRIHSGDPAAGAPGSGAP